MDRQPTLVVTAGSRSSESFAITPKGLVIGRDPGCDISLDDPSVSREHARVFLHNSAVWAQDSGSRNGVFVNGKRLSRPKQISPGDKLTVGEHGFTVELRKLDGDDEVSNITVAPRAAGSASPAPAAPAAGGGPPRALLIVVGVAVLLAAAGVAVALLS